MTEGRTGLVDGGGEGARAGVRACVLGRGKGALVGLGSTVCKGKVVCPSGRVGINLLQTEAKKAAGRGEYMSHRNSSIVTLQMFSLPAD